jgi:aminopeptidase N
LFVLAAISLPANLWAQHTGGDTGTADQNVPSRRAFAKPGTPRRDERIRYFDVKHIKAELTIDTQKREVRGTVTHTISPLHPHMTQVELDCGSKLKVAKVTIGPKAVSCGFSTKNDTLSVTLDRAYGPDEALDLAIAYSGPPEKGLHFVLPESAYPEKTLSFWTQGEADDTRHWLPCYDYPNDRATSEMIITAEKPLFVLSNGVLIETKDSSKGWRTYHWKMNTPHVSYLISLAAADFAIYHDRAGNLPLDYYVLKHVDEATARRLMGKTPQMIRFFGEVTGEPYPYAKYAQVCMPDFLAGGMENISATTLTDTVLHDETQALEADEDGLVAHELAHQWFGDLVTCKDWSHLWLNEGFASYFDPLFTERDRSEDAFRLTMRGALDTYLASDRGYRRPIVEARYESSESMFDAVTYSKGACVLHMLRGLLGDEAWWKGIRRYVVAHKFQVVETDDFRKAMETASGKDLKWFFNQWVYKGGHPELKVQWRFEDADKTVRVQVQQAQKLDDQTPLFRLPTTLEITEDIGKTHSVPVVIDGTTHEFVIPSAVTPRMVQIDPEGWLIKEIEFKKSPAEHRFELEHARSMLARLDAARALVPVSKTDPESARSLANAWKREKAPEARRAMVELLCNGEETLRAALLEAARANEPRVRVAAVGGLIRLKRDEATEALLRSVWSNPREAYGARREALRGLVAWKVKDADDLLAGALKISGGHHTLAATALELLLEQPGAKSRELAALYSRYGQPQALRHAALVAFPRLAKDDSALQDVLVGLVGDRNKPVRIEVWNAIRELNVKKALPALEAQLAREPGGSGFMQDDHRHVLESAIKTLKEHDQQPKSTDSGGAAATQGIAELERQAAELETKARELRNRIADLKTKETQSGTTGSNKTVTSDTAETE